MVISNAKITTQRSIFRLQVAEKITKKIFLVDTVADISVLPLTSKATASQLYASNGLPIKLIGENASN